MILCIPVKTDNGVDSIVFEHFGSAPGFIFSRHQDQQH
jgi:predicted Fe-Mo cluster-binding NifX family protein